MKILTKSFYFIFFLIYTVKGIPTPINSNIYNKIDLNKKYILSENFEENIYDTKNNAVFQINSGNITNEDEEKIKKDNEVKDNREKNKIILFIFLGSFLLIILITFIIISIYIRKHNLDIDGTIEEDQDYSNIGGITGGSEKDDTKNNIKTEEGKIN